LDERCEDISQRAIGSDYLLSGLVTCAGCGQRYVGNAAHGRLHRYRYYTCFSRQRYGSPSCPSQRLPADEFDGAVFQALVATYERQDLFDRIADQAGALRPPHGEQLADLRSHLKSALDTQLPAPAQDAAEGSRPRNPGHVPRPDQAHIPCAAGDQP
jgi:hypothetical protein